MEDLQGLRLEAPAKMSISQAALVFASSSG